MKFRCFGIALSIIQRHSPEFSLFAIEKFAFELFVQKLSDAKRCRRPLS